MLQFLPRPLVSETDPDRSFFESVLQSISNFTEDQKLEFRCEVLHIIKRMRNLPTTQNYEYVPNVPYFKSAHVPGPLYLIANHSNYLNRPQFPIHSRTRLSTPVPQPQNPSMNFNPISPSSSSSTTMDNQAYIMMKTVWTFLEMEFKLINNHVLYINLKLCSNL